MKSVDEIIWLAKKEAGCVVLPAQGLPLLSLELPHDLRRFYELCGGIDMFPHEDWGWRIVKPEEFKPILVQECLMSLFNEGHGTGLEDTLYYLAVRGAGPDSASIDLRPETLGLCYDTFSGDIFSPLHVIALSFTEMLFRMFQERQKTCYWAECAYGCLGFRNDQLAWRNTDQYREIFLGKLSPYEWQETNK